MLINFEECIINHSSIQLRKYGILNGSLLSSPQRRRTALPPLLYSLSTNFLKREEFSHAYAQLQSITHFADVWTNSLVRILNTIASYHSYSSCSLLSSFPALSHTRPQCTNGMNFQNNRCSVLSFSIVYLEGLPCISSGAIVDKPSTWLAAEVKFSNAERPPVFMLLQCKYLGKKQSN